MRVFRHFISVQILLALVFLFSCSTESQTNSSDPHKKAIVALREYLDEINNIPFETTRIETEDGGALGATSHKNRTNHFDRNLDKWTKLFGEFDALALKLEGSEWLDDILFCSAYGHINAAMLHQSGEYADNAIGHITKYLEIRDEILIEQWTKDNFLASVRALFRVEFYSDKISDEENIKQMLHLFRAHLYDLQKRNPSEAVRDYKIAVKINPESFWAFQAKDRIDALEEEQENPCDIPGKLGQWQASYCMFLHETHTLESKEVLKCFDELMVLDEASGQDNCELRHAYRSRICEINIKNGAISQTVQECIANPKTIPRFVLTGEL